MNSSSKLYAIRPLAARFGEHSVIFLLLLSGLVVAVAPKGLAALTLLLAIFAAVSLWARGERFYLPVNAATFSLFALFIWAGISVLWAQDIAGAGRKFGQLTGFMLCLFPLWRFAVTTQMFSGRRVRSSLLVSFLVSWVLAAFFVFFPAEFVNGIAAVNAELQAVGMPQMQMQDYVTVSNRALTVLVPLTFVLFACFAKHTWIYPPILVMVFSIAVNSNNQSALIGLTLPVVFILVGGMWPKLTRNFFIAAVIMAAVLIVPLSVLNYHKGLSAMVMPEKFVKEAHISQRTDLYYAYAMAWTERPLVGYGLDSSASVDFGDKDYNLWPEKTSVHHPHNFFLQLFYELGVPGLLSFVVILLHAGRRLEVLPVVLSVLGISFFAYNLWQSWLLGMFCLVFFLHAGLVQTHSKTA
ncbi:MAG: O-antigen ligase family protein [Parvibaculales bacterium]